MSVESPAVLFVFMIATGYVCYSTYKEDNKPLSFIAGVLCLCFLGYGIYFLLK